MTTSADINPAYISSAAVPKQETRNQLQIIKDAIAAVEARTSYIVLDTEVVVAPVGAVSLSLPVGYNAYRIEMLEWRGVSDGALQMRISQDAVTFYSSAGNYDGCALDWNSGGVAATSIGSTEATLLASQGAAKPGAFGHIEMPYARNRALFDVGGMRPDNVRARRSGFFGTAGTDNLAVQFFVNGGAINLAVGCTFIAMGRL